MPPIPSWVLGLFFWLHMLATVTWIGSLVAISMLVLPAAKGTLSPTDQLRFLTAMQKRLEPVAWFSMGLLVVTGLFQLSSNPHYDGFLSTSGQWSIAILVKHSLAAVMVVVSARGHRGWTPASASARACRTGESSTRATAADCRLLRSTGRRPRPLRRHG